MPSLTTPILRRMALAAREAATFSYSPYSKFAVGAAVLAESGKIYRGCNVENASYGLCNCAERTAIFTGVAAGERRFRAVVVYTPTPSPTMPCGACRQVINEFAPDAEVVSVCDSAEQEVTSLPALLPSSFGPADLAPKKLKPGARRPRAR